MNMPADKPIAEMDASEVQAAARAKLLELSLCDLRFHFEKYAKVVAGGPCEFGNDHQLVRAHLRQLLSDIQIGNGE
jgi:hypothetical protein